MKSVIGNMIMDTILIAIAISLFLIVEEWDTMWRIIALVIILTFYGTIHGILTIKRLGYGG